MPAVRLLWVNRVEQRLCNSFVRCGFCRKISKKRGMVCIISLFTDEVFLTNLSFQHLLFLSSLLFFVAWRRRADSFLVALIRFLCCRYFLTPPSLRVTSSIWLRHPPQCYGARQWRSLKMFEVDFTLPLAEPHSLTGCLLSSKI